MNDTTLANGLQVVKNFADGLYGSGPFYWNDPYAVSQNVMPPHWAAPMLAETDWPDLDFSVAPTFVAATYANNFPYKYASYVMPAYEVGDRKVTILIPSTHTLSFGWSATASGVTASSAGGVRITPYLRSTGAATSVQNPNSLLAGSATTMNTTFDGATYSFVEIYVANGSASSSTLNIVAMTAQVLLTGTTPVAGGFIPGKGTTGLEFASFPDIEYYSSAINSGQIGLSVTLTEI
jgi:hypothetical protein